MAGIFEGKNFGTTLSGLGSLGMAYASYKQAKAAEDYNNKLLELEKEKYQRGIQREDLAQSSLDDAINSVWGVPKKEEDILGV